MTIQGRHLKICRHAHSVGARILPATVRGRTRCATASKLATPRGRGGLMPRPTGPCVLYLRCAIRCVHVRPLRQDLISPSGAPLSASGFTPSTRRPSPVTPPVPHIYNLTPIPLASGQPQCGLPLFAPNAERSDHRTRLHTFHRGLVSERTPTRSQGHKLRGRRRSGRILSSAQTRTDSQDSRSHSRSRTG